MECGPPEVHHIWICSWGQREVSQELVTNKQTCFFPSNSFSAHPRILCKNAYLQTKAISENRIDEQECGLGDQKFPEAGVDPRQNNVSLHEIESKCLCCLIEGDKCWQYMPCLSLILEISYSPRLVVVVVIHLYCNWKRKMVYFILNNGFLTIPLLLSIFKPHFTMQLRVHCVMDPFH